MSLAIDDTSLWDRLEQRVARNRTLNEDPKETIDEPSQSVKRRRSDSPDVVEIIPLRDATNARPSARRRRRIQVTDSPTSSPPAAAPDRLKSKPQARSSAITTAITPVNMRPESPIASQPNGGIAASCGDGGPGGGSGGGGGGVPNELLCPITLCIMSDPVLAMDGHTYERAAIERWLRARRTSPRTGAPLASRQLVPNHAIRALIADLPPGLRE